MPAELLSSFLRHERAIVLGALATVVAAAWAYLLLGAGIDMEMMDMGGGQLMAMAPEWTAGYAALICVMWVVMMAAMMLPSAAPTILLVAALKRNRGGSSGAVPATAALFASGYILVWSGFSLAAALLQWGLSEAGLLSETMALGNAILVGAVLVAVGVYQWTPLKDTCLRHCRSPAEFLVGTGAAAPSGPSAPASATVSSVSAAAGC
jgi:predicted metal-binding membrane protein